MKKLLLLALITIIMTSCGKETAYTTDNTDIVVIDNCEYLKCSTYGYAFVYTHKGNCKFCQERRKQELEELIEQIERDIVYYAK